MGKRRRAGRYLGVVVLVAAGLTTPARAGGGCATGDLKPALHEFMVNQGLPYNGAQAWLVRGKNALIRLFLGMPDCATPTDAISITGGTLAVYNDTNAPAIGPGKLFSPLVATPLAAAYTTTPAPNNASDPIFTVAGSVLTPCGGATPCSSDGFSATFRATISYRANGGDAQQVVFSNTQTIGRKSNALRILVVPMGDPTQTYRSQYSLQAEALTRQGMTTLARIFPVPNGVGELCPPPSAGQSGCAPSQNGGIRYHVDLSAMVNLKDPRLGLRAYTPDGKFFCGGANDFDGIKQQLAQLLMTWNLTNKANSADVALGVVDEAISAGGDNGCVDGMGAIKDKEAWVRAIAGTATSPSRTGSLMAMEIAHTFGVVMNSATYHSAQTQADGLAPDRAYNVDQRAFLAKDHSVMDYDNTGSPWNNDDTLFEPLDEADSLCLLDGPPSLECATPSIPYGTAEGVAAGSTIVATGITDGTEIGTKVTESYVTQDVAHTAPDESSRYRLVETNLAHRLVQGFPVHVTGSDHTTYGNGSVLNSKADAQTGSFAFALEDGVTATAFSLWYCPQASGAALDACKAAPDEEVPAGSGNTRGVHLYGRAQQATPDTFTQVKGLAAGKPRDFSATAGASSTVPSLSSNGHYVAWQVSVGATPTVYFAPVGDIGSAAALPGSDDTSPTICPGGSDTSQTIVFERDGWLYTTTVDPRTLPLSFSDPQPIYQPSFSNDFAHHPSCTQDGRVVFSSNPLSGYPQISIVDLDGGNLRQVTFPPGGDPNASYAADPSASRTSGDHRIAYDYAVCDHFGTCGEHGIRTLDPDNPDNTQANLVVSAGPGISDIYPGWGTDGRITYQHSETAQSDGILMSVDANGATQPVQLSASGTDSNSTSAGALLAFSTGVGRAIDFANLSQSSVAVETRGTPDDERLDLVYRCANGVIEPVAAGLEPDSADGDTAFWTTTFDPSTACGGGAGTLIPSVSDGFTRTEASPLQTVSQTVDPKPPVASLSSPPLGATYSMSAAIPLNGGAFDPEQGELASLAWTIDGIDKGHENEIDVAPPPGGWSVGTHTARLTATDANGLTSVVERTFTVVDDVPPAIALAHTANGNLGWNKTSPVAVQIVASDVGAGLSAISCTLDGSPVSNQPALAAGSPSYSGTVNVTAQGTHAVVCVARDGGNNTSLASDVIKLDTGLPSVSIVSPPANATYVAGQVVNASYTCGDAVSGTASCTGSVANGSPIDTATAGAKTFTVVATDVAGNQFTRSVSYTVVPACRVLSSGDVTYDAGTVTMVGGIHIGTMSPTVHGTLAVGGPSCSNVRYTMRVFSASAGHALLGSQPLVGDGSSQLTFSLDMGNGTVLGPILDPTSVCVAFESADPGSGAIYDRIPSQALYCRIVNEDGGSVHVTH